MKLITGTITFPEEIPYSLKESKEGFVKLLLLYAALKLFEEGKLSLGKAATLAGYSRIAFIDILSQHHISVLNYTEEALDAEIQAAQNLAQRLEDDDHC
jgi:predicted HTH domain antitoxin